MIFKMTSIQKLEFNFLSYVNMPRKYAKTTRKVSRVKRTYKRRYGFRRSGYRTLAKRISAVSKRVAGELCKWESTPITFGNTNVVVGTSSTLQRPLQNITSGTPYIYPINWIYTEATGSATGSVYANGSQLTNGQTVNLSFRNPIWYNTALSEADPTPSNVDANITNDVSPGLQYRLKYIYINALFNASINSSVNNTDGALRIVIVKDKQPTGGAATWFDENSRTNSRGVFNAQRIDAQLNPNTVGRFKVMYDKVLRFNTTNGYKPFKYFRKLSTVVRNNRDLVPARYFEGSTQVNNTDLARSENYLETSERPPPVLKNAFYLMIFSDGLNFTYSSDSSTPAAGFHLFNRVAYYNN